MGVREIAIDRPDQEYEETTLRTERERRERQYEDRELDRKSVHRDAAVDQFEHSKFAYWYNFLVPTFRSD